MPEMRMGESSDHAAMGGNTAANDAVAAHITPKLTEQSGETKTAAAPARSKRFVMLAASVAFAAGFGSFVGSVSGSGLARFIYPPPAPPAPASGIENTIAAMREIKLEHAELAALKTSLDSTARNTANQYAKIAERLDRIDQRVAGAAGYRHNEPCA